MLFFEGLLELLNKRIKRKAMMFWFKTGKNAIVRSKYLKLHLQIIRRIRVKKWMKKGMETLL